MTSSSRKEQFIRTGQHSIRIVPRRQWQTTLLSDEHWKEKNEYRIKNYLRISNYELQTKTDESATINTES